MIKTGYNNNNTRNFNISTAKKAEVKGGNSVEKFRENKSSDKVSISRDAMAQEKEKDETQNAFANSLYDFASNGTESEISCQSSNTGKVEEGINTGIAVGTVVGGAVGLIGGPAGVPIGMAIGAGLGAVVGGIYGGFQETQD